MKYILTFILSTLMLLIEKLWQKFWMVISIAMFFIFLSLINVPQSLGNQWHLTLVSIFAITILATAIYQFRKFKFPSKKEIEKNIEISSNIRHRPISTTKDTPIDKTSVLWDKHLKHAKELIKKLRIYKPKINVTKQDKFALRHISLLLLITGFIIAGYDWDIRIKEGFSPEIKINSSETTLDIWIDPPKYVDKPAVFLNSSSQGLVNKHAITIKDSVLKIRATGYIFSPRANYIDKKYKLEKSPPNTFSVDIPLKESGILNVNNLLGNENNWAIKVEKDNPPIINLLNIKSTSISSTKIKYIANDDNKISEIKGLIKAHPSTVKKLGNDTYYFNIPNNISDKEQTHLVDLTSHIWAGRKVNISLKATDSLDQKSISSISTFILPERRFKNPTSKKIALDRKKLIRSKSLRTRKEVAKSITQIASYPRLHKGSLVDFLALRTISRRLIYGFEDPEEKNEVIDLLWDIAIKLEDGGLLTAQSDLYNALQKMQIALTDKNISNNDLQSILNEVQMQIQKYIMAMAMELNSFIKQGKIMPTISSSLANKLSKKINLNTMMDQIKNIQDAHSLDDLQQIAKNLQKSLENFSLKDMNKSQQKQMAIMKALEDVEKIIAKQELLLSTTNKIKDKEKTKVLEKTQNNIKEKLVRATEKLVKTTGTAPSDFATAYQNMEQSAEALKNTFAQTSIIHQQKVLEALKKGVDESLNSLAEALQKSMMSFNFLPQGQQYGEGHDPLGRKMETNGIKIPDKIQRRKIQIILDELRRRSNDSSRSLKERDYIERLID